MSINDIAYKLNQIATAGKNAFASIQEIRQKNGRNPRTWSPFASFSIKDNYAFHAGGRKELQFNIGYDFIDEKDVFRYGLAFSLIQDKTLHNPKADFKDRIERFNDFFVKHENFFRNFKMWYYRDYEFQEYFDQVKEIDDRLFHADSFIFIGKYFEKDTGEINDNDIKLILETFDYLIPLYEYVEFGDLPSEQIETRVARICWNDNGWVCPSGYYGKSEYIDSHESKYGYGHEEWLFDLGKIIGGYHYGFLEPIRKQQEAYSAKFYNVWLYSINAESKKRYWIGEILNLEVLNKDESEKIKREYEIRGWLKEMEEQIKHSGANAIGFSNWKGVELFNIRFHPSDIKLNDPYFELPVDHPISAQSRYSFAHFQKDFLIEDQKNFSFISSEKSNDGEKAIKVETKVHYRQPRSVEITYLHTVISYRLTENLRKVYGFDNVTPEHPSGYGANRIDIVVKDKERLIFYEIKTYPTLKSSIREAIGQLMEYALWINHKKADELIVITQPHKDFKNASLYFKHLRNTFNLPLYYQSFDIETNYLSEKV